MDKHKETGMIKELREQEYGPLYRGRIERDFVRNERRPLHALRRLHRKGKYTLLVLRDDKSGKLLAYAGLLHSPGVDSMLLDYFAVEPEYRGTGVGSRFMGELASFCDTGGILIECETPAQARSTEEKKTRERRIEFYLRNGAERTGVEWHFVGVHYDLLWLSVHKSLAEVDVAQDIPLLYNTAAPKLLMWFTSKVLEKGVR